MQTKRFVPTATILVLLVAASRVPASDLVWTNTAGGSWAAAANWSPNQVPGAADTAWITNSGTYTVTSSADASIAGLTLGGDSGTQTLSLTTGTFTLSGNGTGNAHSALSISGGIFAGAGTLALAGPLTWTGGTISGGVQCNGGSIAGSAPHKSLTGGRLVNAGVLTFSHSAASGYQFYTGSGSVISNLPGATFDLVTDAGTSYSGSGARGTIYNAGLWRKSAGTGLAMLDDTFHNTGTVEAASGTLQLASGGSNRGTNRATGSAKLDFGGGTHTLDANAWLVGSGTIGASGGTVNFSGTCALPGTCLVNGGTLNFNNATLAAVGSLTVTGGTLGGSGWVVASGALTWTGGTISGGVQCNGGSIAGSAPHKSLTGGRLVNAGVLTFSHSAASGYQFYTGSGSVISNLPGATFDLVTDAGTSYSGSGARGTIYNAGLWRKSAGTGLAMLDDTFHNTGTVEAASGTLQLASGGSNRGTNRATGSAKLDFGGGTHTLDANAWLVGSGTIGASGGTVNFSGTCALPGTCLVNGGTLNFNNATLAAVGSLTVTGGTLGGSGWVVASGALTWTGGTISGGVQCNGGSIAGSAPHKSLTGGRLVNAGVLTFSHSAASGYQFYTGSGSVISNLPGATFDLVTDAGTSYSGSGARGTIYNAGLWRKSAGTGLAMLDDTFHNTGTVEAASGTLQLASGGSNRGTNRATGSAKLDFGGGTHTLDANAWLVGSGTIGASGGTVNFSGTCALPGTCLVNGGTLNFNNATLAAVGSLTVTGGTLGGSGWVVASGALTWTGGTISGGVQCNGGSIAGSAPHKSLTGGRLVNAGVLTFSHSAASGYQFYTGSGSVISNLPGATFDLVTDAGTSYSGSGARGTIYNAGLWRKSAGTGLAMLDDTFHNTGTVEAASGTLQFAQPFTQADGATWLLSGRLQVDQGFVLIGGLLAGTNTVIGSVTNYNATLSPGASPGVLTITGHYTESTNAHLQIELGGPAPGSGHDQLSVGGTATLAGTLDLSFWNGFTPAPGNVFTALVCNARSGAFSAIQAPTSTLGVLYNPKSLSITNTGAQPTAPDFIVTSITFNPAIPLCGQPFTAYVTLTNQGAGMGDGGWLDVWTHQPTRQACGANGDQYKPIGALAAGAGKTMTFAGLTAPASGAPWTFRAFVDSTCATAESNDTNNQTTVSYGSCPVGKPDFVVTTVTFSPPTPVCGRTFTAYVTVKNQGAGPGVGGWLDIWKHRTKTPFCGAHGDAFQKVGALAAGASKTHTFSGLNAPTNSAPWTFRAVVDSACATTESNEANNLMTLSYGACPGPPDFAVTSITFNPASPICGRTFTANVTVTNQGAGMGDAGWLDVWTHEPKTQACGADGDQYKPIGTLAAGASKTLTFTRLDAPSYGTPWNFRAFVDSMCATAESNETNNQTTVSYGFCPAEAPDFAVTAISLNPPIPLCGQRFTATVTVTNQGVGVGGCYLVIWKDRPTPPVSVEGGNHGQFVPTLAAGASETITFHALTAPTNSAPWTFRAFPDANGKITESNEGNNQMTVSYGACVQPPDFVVTSITFDPATPLCGQPFTANVTVMNQGAGASDGGFLDVWVNQATTANCVWASGSPRQSVGTLAAGASKTLTFIGLSAPPSGAPWFFRAFVDSGCTTPEINDNNNQLTASYGFCGPQPDFSVWNISISPPDVKPGGTFSAYVYVANFGAVPGVAGWVDVWANKSTSASCGDDGDGYQQVGYLNPGEIKLLTFAGLTAGPAGPNSLRVSVDTGCATGESNETNNQASLTYYPAVEVWDFLVMPEAFYNPSSEQWADVKNQFRRASNFLYDATDGQVRLGLIHFKDPNWDYPWEADELRYAHIQLWHVVRSMAIPGWVVLLGMVDPADPDNMEWHCFSTIVHELGHYKFRLYDEYTDSDGWIFGGSPRTRYCKSRLRSGSIMDANFYGGGRGTSEDCTPTGSHSMHDPRDWTNDQPAYTVQDFIWGHGSRAVSAWEVINHYNAAIRMPTGDPLPGPCSMSSDPYAELSHEPLGDNEGAAVWVNIVGP